MPYQGQPFGTELLPPKATPLRTSGRMSFLQYLWKGRRCSPGSETAPKRPPRHPDPSILLPMEGTQGVPAVLHSLPCPTDEGAALTLPLSPIHEAFHQQNSRPIAWGGPGIPPISGRNPGAPNQLSPAAGTDSPGMPRALQGYPQPQSQPA